MEKNFILKVNFKGSDEERFYIFDDEEFAKDVAKMIYSMNKDSHGKVICSLIPSVKYTDYDEVPELANHCPDYKERSMAYIERIAKTLLLMRTRIQRTKKYLTMAMRIQWKAM